MIVLDSCLDTQWCVYREYNRGLKTQPWNVPVLRVKVMIVSHLLAPSVANQLKSRTQEAKAQLPELTKQMRYSGMCRSWVMASSIELLDQ